jgi:hypothetical protein
MADYDSSLPVRTEAAGDVDVFISDSTTPTQKLKVNADGSIDTNTSLPAGTKVEITDGTDDLDINADGSINVKQDKLDASTDNVAISDGTDQLEINADGSINATVSATDLDIRDLVFATDKVDVSNSSNVGVVATDLDIRDLAFATDKVDVSGSDITATVSATDLDIRDLDAAQDSVKAHLNDENGNPYSATNPLAVAVTGDAPGDEIVEFNTSAAVAKDASVNHDYTVSAGKTLLGEEAWISGSGKLKVEMLVNGATVFVGFNSTANPNVRIPLEKMVKADAAQVVRFTITNRDKQAQDVYSTLTGLEV